MNWQKLYNPIVSAILCSPLHGLLSGSTLLLTYRGRRSGQEYRTPVSYARSGEGGRELSIFSDRERTWWRNFRPEAAAARPTSGKVSKNVARGVPLRVRLAGRDLPARAEAVEDPGAVAEALLAYLRAQPGLARYFGVGLDSAGRPVPEEVIWAAQERVLIRLTLEE